MSESVPPRGLESDPIALVDDDPGVRRLMRHWLETIGYRTVEFDTGHALLEQDVGTFAAICLDLGLEDVPGVEVLQHLRARDPNVSVVIVTAQREVDAAVAAMRAGAYDYVVKPIDRERFVQTLARAIERRTLLTRVRKLKSDIEGRAVMGTLIGQSAAMQELGTQIARVAGSDVSICIMGESGTGKELVAQAIHRASPRRSGPFVAINCAAIPSSLQESDLFGHEKGAFTGATGTHRGRFEQAQNGTLFLDEVGEMSPATQASLLRALQERTIRRVGGVSDIKVNARIVSATNRDLAAEVTAGRFREDLYFRLVVYPIRVAPLRNRSDDVPHLVAHFLQKLSQEMSRTVPGISVEALEVLQRHAWPGNVRELQNVMQRALLSCDGDEIELAHLPSELTAQALPRLSPPTPRAADEATAATATVDDAEVVPLQELERRAIANAMRAAEGNVTKAARMLGMGRATLYRRLMELGIGRASA